MGPDLPDGEIARTRYGLPLYLYTVKSVWGVGGSTGQSRQCEILVFSIETENILTDISAVVNQEEHQGQIPVDMQLS